MDLGEKSWETPFLKENVFIQSIQNYTKSTTINLCRQLNCRSLATDLYLSFTVRMHLSISAKCSFADEVLTTVLSINSSLVESNSISIKIVCTIIIPLEYNLIIIFSFLVNCLAVRVGMCLTVTNLISRYFVIKKGMLFTNITSSTRFTDLCNVRNPWK